MPSISSVSSLGVIGLGTMGANLARNAMRNGAEVILYNRTTEKTDQFVKEFGNEGTCTPTHSLEDFANAFTGKKAILLMVKAGEPVDAVIEQLLPLLKKGDILIDGGNSHFPDTQRRFEELHAQGVSYLGMGVSGGEEGALNGPSMMPGGDKEAYEHLHELLYAMAADDNADGKCIAYIGGGGSGHFVKMVHNGIEYGIMQLIAECYHILKELGEYSNDMLAETFAAWNATPELESFLVEITAKIFTVKDDKKKKQDLIDAIKDAAKQKGTGKWTSQAALDEGVAIPTITAGVDARIISGSANIRKNRANLPVAIDETEPAPPPERLRSMVKAALELSIICCYQQGFDLIERASNEHEWNVNLSECARIWRGGCIIRSAQLARWQSVYGSDASKAKGASEQLVARFDGENQRYWRLLLEYTVSRGIPTPALSASINYYDSVRRDRLPQNLVQAQRDFFGAHTYERIDAKGTFHSQWTS